MNVVQFGGMHRLTQCHTLPSGVRGCMMHTEFLLEFLIKNYSNIDLLQSPVILALRLCLVFISYRSSWVLV